MAKDPFDGIFTSTTSEPQSGGGFDGIFVGEATPLDGFAATQSKEMFAAPYKSSPTDTGLQAGAKAIGNLPSSAARFGKGLFDLATNPVQSAKALGTAALGGFEKLIPGTQKDEAAFNQITSFLKQRYGSLEALQKTATEDPFGFGTDLAGVLSGGATIAGRGAQAANVASKVAQTATAPIRGTVNATKNVVQSTAKFATSQATGLSPDTISQVIKNPSAFGRSAENTSRSQLAEVVGKALDTRADELSDIGSGYDEVRKAAGNVQVPNNLISNVLDKYGIKLEDGKIVTSVESTPLEAGDRAAIQNFIDNYGSATTLSNNAFLNVRKALSNLSKYDQSKSNVSTTVARDLRASFDTLGKDQIKGLAELDALYGPEAELVRQLKKDIFTPTGDLKDGAINKIANLTGKGKDQILARMKEIVPDIDDRVRVLKAVEDIEAASGLKVGTYTRAGAAIAGATTGNVPIIIGAILSQPEVAVPLLRAYGYTGEKAAEVLAPLRAILEDVNNFKIPAPAINYLNQQQPGLSTKAVRLHTDDSQALTKFIDAVRSAGTSPQKLAKIPESTFKGAESIFIKLNQNLDVSIQELANIAEKILTGEIDASPLYRTGRDFSSTGIKSSKQSKAANMSTSNALTGRGDVSVPKTDMSGGFDGADQKLIDNLTPRQREAFNAGTPAEQKGALEHLRLKYDLETNDGIVASKPSPSIPKELEGLAKHKTLEEFKRATPIVYHGSPVPLKKFSNKKGGVFFTEEYADATGFAGSPDNVYEGYLNFQKPLVIDAKGAKWDALDSKYGKSTQQVISNAQKDGYDGVIFKNVIDNIADDAEAGIPGTIYYAYKPEDAFLNENQLTDFFNKVKGNK